MRRLRRSRDEDGSALLSVIGFAFVFSILAAVSVNWVINGTRQAREHEDWHGALAAAEAGLEDYVYRLNRNPAYYATHDEDNTGGNAALDGWAPLAGPDTRGVYHYSVDASDVNSTGALDLTVSGRVGEVTRTLEARLRPDGFLDYIYFTNYETIDPGDPNNNLVDWWNQWNCDDYYPQRPARCADIRFVSQDTITGPLRTNDAMAIDGSPTFTGTVQTAWGGSGGQLWRDADPVSTPDFQQGIERAPLLDPPPTNTQIRDQTTSATTGCNYYGPTYIHIDGQRMFVDSPLSDDPPSGQPETNDWCLPDSGTRGWVDIPDNGVVYVSNHTGCGWHGDHPLDMPRPGDQSRGDSGNPYYSSSNYYKCDAGDAFVWGEIEDDQVTIAAENNIYVVWDLTYANGISGNELIGLIANNMVEVYHPVGDSCSWYRERNGRCNLDVRGGDLPPFDDDQPPPDEVGNSDMWITPDIHAAILSLESSFRVQNWLYGEDFGDMGGELSVVGAISQGYRGVVGTGDGDTGYPKDYIYDDRLQYLSPPFFILPEESAWRPRQIAESVNPTDLPG